MANTAEKKAARLRDFEHSLPMELLKAREAAMARFRPMLRTHGLTEQQWRVLRTLWEDDSLSSIELARRTLLPAASLVGVLDRLEKKGLIVRLRSVEDRRIVFAKPTPEGRKLEREIAPRLHDIHQAVRRCVTEEEWQNLSTILRQFESGPAFGCDAETEEEISHA